MSGSLAESWEVRVGSFPVRASCWACGADLLLAQRSHLDPEPHGVCPHGCCSEPLCLNRMAWKFCVRERGHSGLHLSPSGSCWAPVTELRPR